MVGVGVGVGVGELRYMKGIMGESRLDISKIVHPFMGEGDAFRRTNEKIITSNYFTHHT